MPLDPKEFAKDVTTRGRLQPYHWADLRDIQPRDYIIKNVLDRGAMSVVYGESGCGKTFLTLDLALHAALARPWFDCKVKRAAALYIAAEGGFGIERRLKAFRIHHNVDVSGASFFVLPTAPDLCDPDADTTELLAEIKRLAPSIGLIIVDTLSRVMAGGNENAPDDMGALVWNCDRIREETGAHLLLVHHTGKDIARGARGHSSLRAATDTEIEVARDVQTKVVAATVMKQRDGEIGLTFAFRLDAIEVGEDQDGDRITSCVVMPEDAEAISKDRARKVTGQPKVALELLRSAIAEAGEQAPTSNHIPRTARVVRFGTWKRYCHEGQIAESDKADTQQKAFVRAARTLQEKELIGKWDEFVWLTD
jgi:hypothetical protein